MRFRHRLALGVSLPLTLANGLVGSPTVTHAAGASFNPACLNVPVRPSEVTPRDCIWTGPETLVVAGSRPGAVQDGRLVAVNGQTRHGFTLSGAGSVGLQSAAAGHACVVVRNGVVDVNLTTGATAACAGSTAAPPAVTVVSDPAPAPASATPTTASTSTGTQPRVATTGPPTASISSYIYGDAPANCPPNAGFGCTLVSQGARATPGTMVILDFGSPCFIPGTTTYGTQLFNTRNCTTADEDAVLMANFVKGYNSNHPAGSAPLILAAGTSNSLTGADPQTNYMLSTAQMQAHAQTWVYSVVLPTERAVASYPAAITVWGASDIEQSSGGDYYGPDPSVPWVDTFAQYAGRGGGSFPCNTATNQMLADYGDDVVGAGGWSQAQIYHVAWGSPVACAVPEIYYTSMANEWAQMNTWATANGLPTIQFTGVMTEDGAGGSLAANDSWYALRNATGQSAPYLTIISSAEPTGAPAPPPPPPAPPLAQGYVAGEGVDGALWRNGAGAPWTSFGGSTLAAPALVDVPASAGSAQTNIAIVTGADSQLWVRTDTADWRHLSSTATSCKDNPAATLAPGTRTLVVVCVGADDAVWTANGPVPLAGSPPVLDNWSSLGGHAVSGPAVAYAAGSGAETVLVSGTDGRVWSGAPGRQWTPTAWGCVGHPALATSAGTTYFGCHGFDGALWYALSSNGTTWTPAVSAGGAAIDGIGIAALGSTAVYAVEGVDGGVWYATITSGGAASGFSPLRGQVIHGVGAVG